MFFEENVTYIYIYIYNNMVIHMYNTRLIYMMLSFEIYFFTGKYITKNRKHKLFSSGEHIRILGYCFTWF